MTKESTGGRIVRAVHGRRGVEPDPSFEIGLADHLRKSLTPEQLQEQWGRYVAGADELSSVLRRALTRAMVRKCGHGLRVEGGVGYRNPETFEFGDGVLLGRQAYLQGFAGGRCEIGNHVWIGPKSYLDARDLVLGDYVGWGPGAKALCSMHTGEPLDVPTIQTDLEIRPVRIEEWADIGVDALILPGVTVGKGSIVGAGAVVTHDVAPFAKVAGVPARFLGWREGYEGRREETDDAVE